MFVKRALKLSTLVLVAGVTAGNSLYADRVKPLKKSKKEVSTGSDDSTRTKMTNLVFSIQNEMTVQLEQFDTKRFFFDKWNHENNSNRYGTSAVLQDGTVFEKAGVNVSIIHDVAPAAMIKQMSSRNMDVDLNKEYKFFVAGVSMVVHPINPFCPTFHANYRYFELLDGDNVVKSWFGGGCDLTPCYLFDEDCKHFHGVIKKVCDDHDSSYYPRFKKWCDQYFYNSHRGEHRGIGGIFFDDLTDANAFEFVADAAHALKDQYIPIIKKRYQKEYTPAQKQWQQIRRGRYVEFNLLHDRGTKFGLATPGVRIESVLMSLPLTCRWEYCHKWNPNSEEDRMMQVIQSCKDWVQ